MSRGRDRRHCRELLVRKNFGQPAGWPPESVPVRNNPTACSRQKCGGSRYRVVRLARQIGLEKLVGPWDGPRRCGTAAALRAALVAILRRASLTYRFAACRIHTAFCRAKSPAAATRRRSTWSFSMATSIACASLSPHSAADARRPFCSSAESRCTSDDKQPAKSAGWSQSARQQGVRDRPGPELSEKAIRPWYAQAQLPRRSTHRTSSRHLPLGKRSDDAFPPDGLRPVLVGCRVQGLAG